MAKTEKSNSPATLSSLDKARAAAKMALENQARDVLILDLRKQTALFDYFVIATGKSGRQLRAIADDIDELLQKQLGDKRLYTEGYQDSRWIVLDYGDLVIHLFDSEMRDFYRLEDVWGDAPRIDVA
ncbi:MAG: ribosome silencing factor [Pirellulales bacterium]